MSDSRAKLWLYGIVLAIGIGVSLYLGLNECVDSCTGRAHPPGDFGLFQMRNGQFWIWADSKRVIWFDLGPLELIGSVYVLIVLPLVSGWIGHMESSADDIPARGLISKKDWDGFSASCDIGIPGSWLLLTIAVACFFVPDRWIEWINAGYGWFFYVFLGAPLSIAWVTYGSLYSLVHLTNKEREWNAKSKIADAELKAQQHAGQLGIGIIATTEELRRRGLI